MSLVKRVILVFFAVLCMITIGNPLLVRAEEISYGTILQYRYREKEYTTSAEIDLGEPWVLYHTETGYTHSNYDYVYLEAQVTSGTGTTSGYSSDEADEWQIENRSKYCFHGTKCVVYRFYRKAGYGSATGPAVIFYSESEYLDGDVDYTHYYPDRRCWQFMICTQKVETITYHYYKWSDWSEWSETAVEATDDREVETREVYTVSYDANGGTAAPASQSKICNEDIVLASDIPTREGYSFLGWSTTANGIVEYSAGDTYSANESVILYAVWEANVTYIIAYEANGGTNAPPSQIKAYNVDLIISDQTPERDGYSFLGWSLTSDGEVEYSPGDAYCLNADITLFAIWKSDTYTVTYDANGGTGAPDAVTVDGGVSVSISDVVPVRDGFTFLGWTTNIAGSMYSTYSPYSNDTYFCSNWRESDGGIGSYTSNDTYGGGEDITLYAVWRVNDSTALGNKCGDNLYWTYDAATLCLTITGDGPMYNFVDAPWDVYASKIKSVILPEGMLSIGNNAFAYSTVGNIQIPSSVVSIGSGAFLGDAGLKTLIIPSTVEQVCFGAFSDCSYLTEVIIQNDGLIDKNTFNGCDRLTSISITGSITRIITGAFTDCGIGLMLEFELPQSLSWITANSIRNTTGTHIYYDGTQTQWSGLAGTKLSNATVTFNRFEIGYDANGGTTEALTQEKIRNVDIALTSDIPVREGYAFLGWATTVNGEVVYDAGDTYSANTDIMLYAVWEDLPDADLAFTGASLALHYNLAINYKIDKALFETNGYSSPYVEFEFNGEKKTVDTYTVEGDKYVFSFCDIAPNQMNDTIYATLYASFGGVEYSSETKEYSVATYCYSMLEKCSGNEYAELRTLLVDLLHYGAASQTYTGYNTNALVDARLTEEQKQWGTSTERTYESILNPTYQSITDPSVEWKGAGLNLQDAVTMRLKFSAESIEGLDLLIESDVGTWRITSEDFVPTDGGYYAFFNGLNASQLSEPVYMTFYNGDTPISNTARYSIESYASSNQNSANTALAELIKAMMRYGDSAYAYVN